MVRQLASIDKGWVIRLVACQLLAVSLLGWQPALAQDNKVFSISPSSVQQGDTVLLTVEGKNLPTGTVVVEFFPQQIAVLNILSAEGHELIIQVKVPNMATPGKYNILIYNHLGEEAFGEAVLNVGSDLITPIFEEYDPKTISDATDGFAVMMTGTLITQDAVDQLEMDWYAGDELVKGLKTEFAMAGMKTVVCAVTGELVGGILRGRVLLNNTPIYMVEIDLQLDRAMLIGVTPSLLGVSQYPYQLKLLGMGISEQYVETLGAVLKSEAISANAETVEFIDEASTMVVFPGPLPPGEYTLEVTAGGSPEYGGMVTLEESEQAVPAPELTEHHVIEPGPGTPDDLETQQAHVEAGVEPEAEVFAEGPVLPGSIDSLDDSQLEPGDNPARLDINCSDVPPEVFERFEAKLRVGMELAELTLVSTGDDKYIYVFSPDENGWEEGETGTLEIIDPLEEVTTYRTIVSVKPRGLPDNEPDSDALANNGSWDVLDARVTSSFAGQQLVVDIMPPDEEANLEAVVCSYTILPDDAGIEDLFEGLNLKGGLQLASKPGGAVAGSASGVFVAGDLLVKLTDSTGASWLATIPVAAPKIGAALVVPGASSIFVDPGSGSVEPAWLRWECRFSQVAPIDPEALSLRSSIELPGAEVLKVLLPDNGIALEIELSGLATKLAEYSEIDFWVDSPTELQWDKPGRITVTVQNASAAQAAGLLIVQDYPVVVTPRGFEVKYKLSSSVEASGFSGAIEASSSLLLLDWDLSGFEIQTEMITLPAGSILIVKFIRDPIALDETAYKNLTNEMTGVGMVGLTLLWPGSGVSDASQVAFSR